MRGGPFCPLPRADKEERPGLSGKAVPVRAGSAFLFLAVAFLASGWLSGASAPGDIDDEIRPFDRVYLKVNRTRPIVGIIEGGWDPETPGDITIRTETGTTTRISFDRIAEVIPRQTSETVYGKKLRAAQSVRERERRAELELALGIWCKTPLAVLGGAMPQPQKAIGHLLHAVDLEPGLHAAYPHLIALLDARGPLEEADGEQIGLEMQVRLRAERGGYEDPELDYRMGVLLAGGLGLPEKGRELLEKVVASSHPNLGQMRRAREILRDIYLDQGTPEKALNLYRSAIREPETSPENFEAFLELARLHARSDAPDRLQTAREFYEKAQAIQPDYVEITAELAALDYRTGDLEAAENRLKKVLTEQNTNIGAAVDLALVWRGRGRRKAAEEALRRLAPGAVGEVAARLHLALGTLLEDREDLEEAVGEYRSALDIDPESSEAAAALAFALIRLGRSPEARGIADRLLLRGGSDRGTFALCSRIRAEADLREGRLKSAAEHLEQAAEVDRALLGRLGLVYLRLGELDRGYDSIQRVHQELGETPATLNGLAFYHYQRGELDEARNLFEDVLTRVPPPEKGSDGTSPPVPRTRSYALHAAELVDDVERLEVWAADFQGEDSPAVPGWTETERFGPEVVRRGGALVLAGSQRDNTGGETTVVLNRRFDGETFERVSARLRVDDGRVRLGLFLEVHASWRGAASGSGSGILVRKEQDGTIQVHVKSSRGVWRALEPTEETAADRGRLVYPGGIQWPGDGAFHSLEIRRARYEASSRSRRTAVFDVSLDGEPVARNVRVSGAGGGKYAFGLTAASEEAGKSFSVTVEGLRIYRERDGK